jgi:hypothetical protein
MPLLPHTEDSTSSPTLRVLGRRTLHRTHPEHGARFDRDRITFGRGFELTETTCPGFFATNIIGTSFIGCGNAICKSQCLLVEPPTEEKQGRANHITIKDKIDAMDFESMSLSRRLSRLDQIQPPPPTALTSPQKYRCNFPGCAAVLSNTRGFGQTYPVSAPPW